MKYGRLPLITCILFILSACGGAETKADTESEQTYNNTESAAGENISSGTPSASAPVSSPDSTASIPDDQEILSRIDRYLVSTPQFNADAGGISNAVIQVRNTLPNTTFQKAIVEVNMIAADGKILRNDFYTIQNIEPGDLETIRLPATAKARTIQSHVVKLKSNALTRGEMILVGALYEPAR